MISSTTNPKIRYLRSLIDEKLKNNTFELVIEGMHVIDEAINAHDEGNAVLKGVLYSNGFTELNDSAKTIKKLSELNIHTEEISQKVVKYLSNVGTPQGIFGIVEYKNYDLGDLLEADNPLLLVLDGIQDPGNLGTIIRTASAFGVSGIILANNSVSLYNQKVVRSTAGSIFKMKSFKVDKFDSIVPALKRRGIKIISTLPTAEKAIEETDLKGPVAIVIGSESKGINQNIIDISDDSVVISMTNNTESLNAAVSTTILLYETQRQRKASLPASAGLPAGKVN